MFFHVLSFSFIFFHCFFLLILLFFSGAQNPPFNFASIVSRFPFKAPMIFFLAVSEGEGGGEGAFFFFLLSIFSCFFFFFVFFFTFFPCFSLFLCFSFHCLFLCFHFFNVFFLFNCVSLFSLLGCSKSVAALQYSLGESAHSELASFTFAHSGDDQVESRTWWVAGGSSHIFVPESPD